MSMAMASSSVMDMSMSMSMPTTTSMSMMISSTASAAMASSTADAAMDMGMGMGGPNACKISMLWNWYTINACFLSSTWHITSHGMFAGSCIGVILLVMVLEALRRAAREYDAYIIRSHSSAINTSNSDVSRTASGSDMDDTSGKQPMATTSAPAACAPVRQRVVPTPLQQAVRSLLHMAQFAVAYIVMLLAMYFNGYIIFCIFIGAFVGCFVFGWHSLGSTRATEVEREITFCCG